MWLTAMGHQNRIYWIPTPPVGQDRSESLPIETIDGRSPIVESSCIDLVTKTEMSLHSAHTRPKGGDCSLDDAFVLKSHLEPPDRFRPNSRPEKDTGLTMMIGSTGGQEYPVDAG